MRKFNFHGNDDSPGNVLEILSDVEVFSNSSQTSVLIPK